MSTQMDEQMDEQMTEQEPVEGAVDENTPQEATGADLSASEAQDESVEAGDAESDSEGEDEQETFPRAYVDKLRKEAAGHRERAKRADEFAAALWEARVAASGRLADPTDLPMPEGADPLDTEAVEAAVEDLLARKPHLATRRPSGNIGQGVGSAPQNVSLAGMLRANV